MTDHSAEREREWREAMIELMDFYEVRERRLSEELELRRNDLALAQAAQEALRLELGAAHERAGRLAARVTELRNPASHVLKAVGRRLRRGR